MRWANLGIRQRRAFRPNLVMPSSPIIDKAIEFVKDQLKEADGSHDWLHIDSVRKNALKIAHAMNDAFDKENVLPRHCYAQGVVPCHHNYQDRLADIEIVELAATLHDVGDFKYSKSETEASKLISQFFMVQEYPKDRSKIVMNIIEHVSYRKELANLCFFSDLVETENDNSQHVNDDDKYALELAIVQDADRIDAIGAVGIARCFYYGASQGHPMYDPGCSPNMNMDANTYNSQSVQSIGNPVNHFYEKLFKIKDKIKTNAGKEIAIDRHSFMEQFVMKFKEEVDLAA